MSRHLSYDNIERFNYKYSYPGMVYSKNINNKEVIYLIKSDQSINYSTFGYWNTMQPL